jgi:hypothetical protein
MRFEVGKDVDLSVFYPLNVLYLEEMVSSSLQVSLFDVIFDLNGVFMATLLQNNSKWGLWTQH